MSLVTDPGKVPTASGRKPRKTKSVRLNFVIGTLYLTLLEYSTFGDSDTNVAIDVSSELNSLHKPPEIHSTLHEFHSGMGTTIRKLGIRHGNTEQLKAMSRMPNVSTEDGIGQIRAYGGWAVLEIMDTADFETLLQELPGKLRQAAGGELKRIVLVFHMGIAGGQASRGGLLLLQRIVQHLSGKGGAILDVSVHLVGSVSFSGPGFPRAQLNGAAAIVEWLNYLRELQDVNVNLSLFLSELPTVGLDKELRSRYLCEAHAGWSAPAVQNHIKTTRSNRAAGGVYGNINFIRTHHFPGFQKQEIATQVATTYLPKIQKCLEAEESPAHFEELEFEYSSASDRYTLSECLIEAVQRRDPEFLLSELLRHQAISATPVIVLAGGATLDLPVLGQILARPLLDPQDVQKRLSLLRGIAGQFADEIANLRSQIRSFEIHKDRQGKRTVNCFEKVLRRSSSRRRRKLKESSDSLRQLDDALQEMRAELVALEGSLPWVEKQDVELVSRIHRLIKAIEPHATHLLDDEFERLIKPIPLSLAFSQLLTVSDSMTDIANSMLHALSRMSGYLTLEGLAYATGVTSPSIEGIVSEVVSCENTTSSPNWGGASRDDKCVRFLVYPPVDPAVKERLRSRHRQLGHSESSYCFARTAESSANVTVVEIRTCREITEVLPEYYQEGLSEVLPSEIRPLYLEDPTILDSIGIKVGK